MICVRRVDRASVSLSEMSNSSLLPSMIDLRMSSTIPTWVLKVSTSEVSNPAIFWTISRRTVGCIASTSRSWFSGVILSDFMSWIRLWMLAILFS